MVTIEEGQERSLGSGRALDTSESEVVSGAGDVPQIPKQLLKPKCASLTDSGKLSRLEVGESKSGEVLVLLGEICETRDHHGELGDDHVASISEEDEIGVVSHEARRGTEAERNKSAQGNETIGLHALNDSCCSRGHETERVDMSHNVVSSLLLLQGGNLKLTLVENL